VALRGLDLLRIQEHCVRVRAAYLPFLSAAMCPSNIL
jgi:hypothetical protein